MSFFAELKRRNVVRVGIAYVLMGWVLLQAADFALDLVDAPNWVIQVFFIGVIIGLPIALFFSWAFEMTPEGIKREHEVDRSQSIAPRTGRKLDFFIIGVLAVVIVVMGVERLFFAGEPETAESAHTEVEVKSIAVLPFVNMSSDPEQEFFSDGITEEVLNALAKVADLKVAGRTSSFAFKGRNDDLRAIGETLGVNHILEGSVRKSGNQVRITAQLIQVEDGFHLWSETYDRELTDVFAIQDEISTAILTALEARLVGDQNISVPVVDLAVYDQFLLARQKVRERNEASLLEAAALLDVVIKADPDYAPAWALRGIAELLMANRIGTYGSIPPREATANARVFLDQALQLDPALPEAYAGIGLAEYHGSNFDAARIALDRALTLSPNHIDAANWQQQLAQDTGELRKAKELALKVHHLDPLYVPAIGNVVTSYVMENDIAAAEALYQRVKPFFTGPALNYVESIGAWIAFEDQRRIEALRMTDALPAGERAYANIVGFFIWFDLMEYEKAIEYMPDTDLSIIALGRLGRREEALQAARRQLAGGAVPNGYVLLLGDLGMHEALVEYIASAWGDVESFVANTPGQLGYGADQIGVIAEAYRSVDDEQNFTRAMKLFREALDNQQSQGMDTAGLWWSEAFYQVLANNQDAALEFMQKSVDRGYLESTDFTRWLRAFKPLLGDPRMTAIQAQMDQTRNELRAQLGLPPVDEDSV